MSKPNTEAELEKQIAGYQLENGDEAIYLIIRRGGQEIAMIGIGAIMPYLEALIHSSNKAILNEFAEWGGGNEIDPQTGKTDVDYFLEETAPTNLERE